MPATSGTNKPYSPPAGQHVSPYVGFSPAERRAAVKEHLSKSAYSNDYFGVDASFGSPAASPNSLPPYASDPTLQELISSISVERPELIKELMDSLDPIERGMLKSMLEANAGEMVTSVLREECTPGSPTDKLAESIGRNTKAYLVHQASLSGLKNAAKLKKDDLVEAITKKLIENATDLLEIFATESDTAIDGIHELLDAGGRIDFSTYHDSPRAAFVPRFPFSFLFATKGGFAIVMPQEMREALAHVDWEHEKDAAKAASEALQYLDLLLDLQGLSSYEEAYEQYRAHAKDPVDAQRLAKLIAFENGQLRRRFFPVMLFEERWLANNYLAENDGTVNQKELERIVDLREQLLPRPLEPEMLATEDLIEWAHGLPAGRALSDYLDAHVPDGADDCLFAWDMMETAYSCASDRSTADADFIEALSNEGMVFCEGQIREILTLYANYILDVPCWDLNGWSRGQLLAALYATDGPTIFRDEDGRAQEMVSNALGLKVVEGGKQADGLEQPKGNKPQLGFVDDVPRVDGDFSSAEDFDYETYERDAARYRAENETYLTEFEEWLRRSGLKASTINKHVGNLDFYLNDFMQYYDAQPMAEGTKMVGEFLGEWFIRKAMWSTPASIRQNAASIKKFYKCMLEGGHIDRQDYEYLLASIKDGLDDWCDTCAIYNSGGPNPFSPF